MLCNTSCHTWPITARLISQSCTRKAGQATVNHGNISVVGDAGGNKKKEKTAVDAFLGGRRGQYGRWAFPLFHLTACGTTMRHVYLTAIWREHAIGQRKGTRSGRFKTKQNSDMLDFRGGVLGRPSWCTTGHLACQTTRLYTADCHSSATTKKTSLGLCCLITPELHG